VLHDIGKMKEYKLGEYGAITIDESVKLNGDHCLLCRDMLYRFWDIRKQDRRNSPSDFEPSRAVGVEGRRGAGDDGRRNTSLADMISSKTNAIDQAIKSAGENGFVGRFKLDDKGIHPLIGPEEDE